MADVRGTKNGTTVQKPERAGAHSAKLPFYKTALSFPQKGKSLFVSLLSQIDLFSGFRNCGFGELPTTSDCRPFFTRNVRRGTPKLRLLNVLYQAYIAIIRSCHPNQKLEDVCALRPALIFLPAMLHVVQRQRLSCRLQREAW